jgi:RHH-type proline utilization regulon transcriptional repressor/proline dehydrogenase/delta 1-pyrroline-5-carboxylate dehydrogenase
MAATTIGVKIDDGLRARIKAAADTQGRTPHWLIKQAILATLDQLDNGASLTAPHDDRADADAPDEPMAAVPQPFLEFAQAVQPQSVLRAAITSAYRRPEPDCVPMLLAQATPAPADAAATATLARRLVEALRSKGQRGAVDGLVQEYALSSQEGVALMCLAEALLRIPDRPTRDALIRDKIGAGDWRAHLGHSASLFVNAATWGLLITGRLTATNSEAGLSAALTRLIGRGGEPLVRKGVDIAMRMMGEQFVTGQTIAEALARSRKMEAIGFRYSYDMLGEAAMTAEDARHYYADYEQAIHAIGRAAAGRGIYEGPGISIKLSALHPRYSRAQRDRAMAELLPRITALAVLARSYDIGLNIDAEEADRLELSLDLLEALCFDPSLARWNGIGFVVQAYQKRAPFVIDHLIDLARRSGRRLMVRLVKGAYWDSEIKRAQQDGLEGFPVFTRKVHTDLSYLACARRMLAVPEAIFPQFATHNAHTVAAIHSMAGANFYRGQYEFQCLHGMGEPLYEEVVGADKLNRPCRVYAPVGTHRTLLAYLVRRLLENGANTSFVNRIADAAIAVDELIAEPAAIAAAIAPIGAAHPAIALPRDMLGTRQNSAGIDLSNEQRLASLSAALLTGASVHSAGPILAASGETTASRTVTNPADRRDVVGHVGWATTADIDAALRAALAAAPIWQSTPATDRAACLERAADLLEARMPSLLGLIVREAGKSLPNAIGEVREAVDFLRYYAERGRLLPDSARPLGPIACISPWNFPLAIFMGQIAAALAAGNPVLAKPAEETPLIAAAAVRLLHEAGIPPGAMQLLPGEGDVGAALVADPRVAGVVFTGSTDVARLIQASLAERLSLDGKPIPLIAETGGQNAMVVDSSALPEQVVADILASAFDSAGQRCSALRVLCLQEEIADRVLHMLKGAMAELAIGSPDRLDTDIGPVITEPAAAGIAAHVAAMRAAGHAVHALDLPQACRHGSFVAPTLIELPDIAALEREIFGPVLHVVRYRRTEFDRLVAAINATGYGLTFGIHTRIDETVARLTAQIEAGNIYVNRNIVGAVVGVQPFGGHGLSGTGPKAGGPLYLHRLLASAPDAVPGLTPPATPDPAAAELLAWLRQTGRDADRVAAIIETSLAGLSLSLPGPVGERNIYSLAPRGIVLCAAQSEAGLLLQLAATLATGNHAAILAPGLADFVARLPAEIAPRLTRVGSPADIPVAAALFEGDSDNLRDFAQRLARLPGPLVALYAAGPDTYPSAFLVREITISTNTAAAGGNASLMSIG